MAKGFKHGSGGGSSLNFKVICNPQPSTAKENTIWVDTDRINNYYFSAEQPENMVDYDVWFSIGTSSSVAFSATKKNPVMVYPLYAKQMVSGALVDKAARSYQDGAWADWITYIVKDGVISTRFDLSGNIRANNQFKLTQESSYLRMYDPTGGTGGFANSVPIDFTEISKLVLVCKIINPGYVGSGVSGCGIGLARALNVSGDLNAIMNNIVASEMRTAAGEYTLELNVESYPGLYYPCIWARGSTSAKPDIYIYDFYYV